MTQGNNLVKMGQFHFIYDDRVKFVVEDKTKRGLPVVENSIDDTLGLLTEKGRFYDANGRGHVVPIRWYFPKDSHSLDQVCKFADKLENRYKTMMEETCP
jgi:hypothetical protein